MKSRINPKINVKPRLIGYCIDEENIKLLSETAAENNIDIRYIGTESACETVGYLAGINGMKPSEPKLATPVEREVLIMAGLKSTVLDRFLDELSKQNVQIDLKCVVTPVNQNWDICRLIDELEREHEAIHTNFI